MVFTFACLFPQVQAQVTTTRILFILDASNSMNGTWQSGIKIDIARGILSNLLDSLQVKPNVQLALRVYGHQSAFPPQDCGDTKLEVPFDFNNADKIKSRLKEIQPKGTTPIARSLQLCVNDFPPCTKCKNIIILITDGIEACSGDPCAIALSLREKGITLKPYVIGIGLDVELRDAFQCVGEYYDASSEELFKGVMTNIVEQVVEPLPTGPATAQIDLLDIYKKPTETNVNMTFYDHKTGKVKYNFIHTLNEKGLPDTLVLESSIVYDIEIHTLPPVRKDNVKIVAGKHNTIPIDAPQGFLKITEPTGSTYRKPMVVVRKAGECNTLHFQTTGEEVKYIVGKYDIEVLSVPRLLFPATEIKQSATTNITLPLTGIANIKMPASGYSSVYQIVKNKQVWVCNLNGITQTGLALPPGKYIAVYRPEKIKKAEFTKVKTFDIKAGESVSVFF